MPDDAEVRLISITAAAAAGIKRLRSPVWANDRDYIRIDIIDGMPGPWLHLFSSGNIAIGHANPKSFIGVNYFPGFSYETQWAVPYEGELDPDDQP